MRILSGDVVRADDRRRSGRFDQGVIHGGAGRDKAGLWSQNLLAALQFAGENGGVTIGLAGFDGGAMKELCDHCIVVPYDTTPHVESYHVAIHHLIAFCLAAKIGQTTPA